MDLELGRNLKQLYEGGGGGLGVRRGSRYFGIDQIFNGISGKWLEIRGITVFECHTRYFGKRYLYGR